MCEENVKLIHTGSGYCSVSLPTITFPFLNLSMTITLSLSRDFAAIPRPGAGEKVLIVDRVLI